MKRIFSLYTFLRELFFQDCSVHSEQYPPEERWWEPMLRMATLEESTLPCKHCGEPLGEKEVAICPTCGLVLHHTCYKDTEGGRAYGTPECTCCAHRTYWR